MTNQPNDGRVVGMLIVVCVALGFVLSELRVIRQELRTNPRVTIINEESPYVLDVSAGSGLVAITNEDSVALFVEVTP